MDEQLRAFVMKILKGMIEEGKASSDIRRYAFARLKDNSINFADVEEIDRLLEERDNPVTEEVTEEPAEESEVEE